MEGVRTPQAQCGPTGTRRHATHTRGRCAYRPDSVWRAAGAEARRRFADGRRRRLVKCQRDEIRDQVSECVELMVNREAHVLLKIKFECKGR